MEYMKELIIKQVAESIQPKRIILEDEDIQDSIMQAVRGITESFKSGGKLLVMGNGGSAADAQHIAGELVSRFRFHRRALPAIALTTNTSVLTSIGNDYEYGYIFERQIEAFAQKGDVVLGLSTSGRSQNISRGLERARQVGALTVCLLGGDGGTCREHADVAIIIPSDDTPRVQEAHILVGHIICHLVEKIMCGEENVR